MKHALTPIMYTLIGEEEPRPFLLSMGGVNRLTEKFDLKTPADLFKVEVHKVSIPILWDALLDKTGLADEQAFADKLPAKFEEVMKIVAQLVGISLPEAKPGNPIEASPALNLKAGTGSDSGSIGPNSSIDPVMNSGN